MKSKKKTLKRSEREARWQCRNCKESGTAVLRRANETLDARRLMPFHFTANPKCRRPNLSFEWV